MAKRERAGQRTLSARLFVATLIAGLIVPVGLAHAAPEGDATPTAPEGDSIGDLKPVRLAELLADDSVELVDGLFLTSDPAPFGPVLAETVADGAGDDLAAEPALGQADTFRLHSRPDATRKILLDFDGQTVTTNFWNGGETIEATAYSFGSEQADESFSSEDLAEIEKIWERVSEDFAAWDVDVTTEDPGAEGLSKNGADDDEYGVRVVITPSYLWYTPQRVGGVAYLYTFARSEDLNAWVFSGNLANGRAKSVAEAVSHEVGHTLGLSHDGITTTGSDGTESTVGYYSGHGEWAPIMGVGYYRPITQWSKGEYPGATTTQDDLTQIDSYIDRIGTTDVLSAPGIIGPGPSTTVNSINAGGEIVTHPVIVESGPVTISLDKVDPDGNLLADLVVRGPSGEAIATETPQDAADWSHRVELPAGSPAGTYLVEVHSRGWGGDSGQDHGFSSYASLGEYVLDIDTPGPTGTTSTSTPTTTTVVGATTTSTTTTTTNVSSQPGSETDPLGGRLSAIAPLRVLDTREADSAVRGPLRAGQDERIDVGVPAGATAVVVNITAVAPRGSGYFTLTSCATSSTSEPTSSLNFATGRNIANSVIVPVSATGHICLESSIAAHAILDLTGWIGDAGDLSLEQLGAQRLVDTRDGTGVSGRLAAGSTTRISLDSMLGSDTVGAVALNVTAIRPAASGFLTIDDCSTGRAATSSLNFAAGEARGNNGVFALGAGNQLCVSSTAATHLTIDVTAEFGTDEGLTFVPATTAERVLDTRDLAELGRGGTITFGVETASPNALTRSPGAASINLTAARHADDGFVTAWGCGPRPTTSALNPTAGDATANGALVELSPSGTTCLFHASGGHLIVDLAGWWI